MCVWVEGRGREEGSEAGEEARETNLEARQARVLSRLGVGRTRQ